MSKLRIPNRYGTTPNKILNNPDISLKAKGLYGFLQSKPDDWKFSEPRIKKQMKEGRDAIHNIIKELEELKYLQRVPVKDEKGRWDGYDYILHESPYNGKPVRRRTRMTGFQSTLSNKDISNKDIVKKNNIGLGLKSQPETSKTSFNSLGAKNQSSQETQSPQDEKVFKLAYKKKRISKRKFIKFKKEDYDRVIKAYEKYKGVQFQGNEYAPLQQTIKTMFMSNRTPDQIIQFMKWLSDTESKIWQNWTLDTIKKNIPLYLAGKLKI